MRRPVNLLSWREARRRNCVRFWVMMFSGLWLVVLLQIVTGRLAHAQLLARQEVYRVNERELSVQLANKEKVLQEQHLRWATAQAHELRRQQTANWEARLLTLAEKLPDQAWLTMLQWQGSQLGLTGMAMRFPALSSVDQMVKSLPGVASVIPGPTRQDQ